MPHLYDGFRVWVEECEKDYGLVYILVTENQHSQDSTILGTAVGSDKISPVCHSWRRHLAEILRADYDPSKTVLLQYFAKDELKPLPPMDDIILASKVIEHLARLEPGIENLENSKGTISQVGGHEITREELQKLHAYFLNRKPQHPF